MNKCIKGTTTCVQGHTGMTVIKGLKVGSYTTIFWVFTKVFSVDNWSASICPAVLVGDT